jgi:hypothetical protein
MLRINVWPAGDCLFGAPSKSAPGARVPLAPLKRPAVSLRYLTRQIQTLFRIELGSALVLGYYVAMCGNFFANEIAGTKYVITHRWAVLMCCAGEM